MNEKDYKVLELLGEMDGSYVEKAAEPWRKKKRYGFSGSGTVRAACAALVVTCGLLCAFQPKVHAAVQSLLSRIGQIAQREEDFAPYARPLELTQTKDGVTLTLQEVILTENQLYAALSMDTDLEQAEIGFFEVGFEGVEEDVHRSYSMDFLPGSSKENGYVLRYTCEDGMIPEGDAGILLKVSVYRNYENPEDIMPGEETTFEFSFSASSEELKKKTLEIPLEQEIEIKPGVVLKLTDFSLNSIFSKISTECGRNDGSLPLMYKQYYLEGTDSLGNEVYYTYQPESGPGGRFVTEECMAGKIPSTESEWVELQLYVLDFSENRELTREDAVALGAPFRIELK